MTAAIDSLSLASASLSAGVHGHLEFPPRILPEAQWPGGREMTTLLVARSHFQRGNDLAIPCHVFLGDVRLTTLPAAGLLVDAGISERDRLWTN